MCNPKKFKDRADYARYDTATLRRMLSGAEDRATRADTAEAAMIDGFQIQEIGAVLEERGAA